MFSAGEIALLLAFGLGLGFALRRLPHFRALAANAPTSSVRTKKQRFMHWASLLLLLPILLAFVAYEDPPWPIIAVFVSHTLIMLALRLLGVGYRARLVLSPLVFFIALAVGFATYAWPALNAQAFASAPWLSLIAAAVLTGASSTLSTLSFPIGFGERAK